MTSARLLRFEILKVHKDTCVGMAANMIGVRKCIIVLLDESVRTPTYIVMLNPEIIKKTARTRPPRAVFRFSTAPSPCKRCKTIKVQYQTPETQTRNKTYSGWMAQIIQHEVVIATAC